MAGAKSRHLSRGLQSSAPASPTPCRAHRHSAPAATHHEHGQAEAEYSGHMQGLRGGNVKALQTSETSLSALAKLKPRSLVLSAPSAAICADSSNSCTSCTSWSSCQGSLCCLLRIGRLNQKKFEAQGGFNKLECSWCCQQPSLLHAVRAQAGSWTTLQSRTP